MISKKMPTKKHVLNERMYEAGNDISKQQLNHFPNNMKL